MFDFATLTQAKQGLQNLTICVTSCQQNCIPPHLRYTVQVEFTVPTNSTGPQALRVSTHP